GVELALRSKQRCSRWAIELTRANITRSVLDRRRQVIHRYAASPHCSRIGLNSNRGFCSVNVNSTDARQDADALTDLRASVVIKLSGCDRVGGERDVHYRLVIWIRL